MCGLTGFFGRTGPWEPETIARMAGTLRHRGPDDAGVWTDAENGIALGHRRLAVIDLSASGHQPMRSASARFVIAFNGEIYNHLEMREELQACGAAHEWRGHSDTETLLVAIEHWGVEGTLRRSVGMFALALWDARERTLHLARDRFGEKPLYYGWSQGTFLFGSELKSLRAYPGFSNAVNRQAIAQFLRFMYVPAPWSIFEDVYKLEPGCLLSIKGSPPAEPSGALRAPTRHHSLILSRWWSLADAVEMGAKTRIARADEAVDALETALRKAVRLQAIADVPLGAFLSGGVDSSLIVSLMQEQSAAPVKTFTVRFEEAAFDESRHAQAVARHLRTEHHELLVTVKDAQSVIPLLPQMYDEPFADSSQIPTHLICRAARQHVTVALSGDAGDELFGGYNRYVWTPRIWAKVGWLPYSLRNRLASTLEAAAPSTWDRLLGHGKVVRPGEKLHKLARALTHTRSIGDVYDNLVTEWRDPAALVRGAGGDAWSQGSAVPDTFEDAAARMMFQDAVTYLPDDILCKLDRAAMAVSLETRVPMLDHRLVELTCRLPISMKIRDGVGKWALRQVLYKRIPRELIERPKTGFALPVGQWLRGPLRPWAEELLDEGRMEHDGFLLSAPIKAAWKQHLSGSHDWTPRLWGVLMFQAWLREGR